MNVTPAHNANDVPDHSKYDGTIRNCLIAMGAAVVLTAGWVCWHEVTASRPVAVPTVPKPSGTPPAP